MTPRTGNPRGRRLKRFREDPDRYAIGFADALQTTHGVSEASAFNLAASLLYGVEVAPEKLRRRQPPGTEPLSWVTHIKPGAVSLPNRASTLRKKAHRSSSDDDIAYRSRLVAAFALVLTATDQKAAITAVTDIMVSIAESAFSEKVLIPMILAKST